MNFLFLTNEIISSVSNVISTVSTVSNVVMNDAKGYDIAFPNLGIFIETLRNNIHIGNFTIAYYGIIIALGMLIGFYVATHFGKLIDVSEDTLYDIFILVVIFGVIGARAYYVIFRWDYYQIRPYEILDIRAGGLAVFGGIILGVIAIAVYSYIKKVDILKVLDATMMGVVIGQAIGRYGNFFNMEAFGGYTNNLLAMRMRTDYIDQSSITFEQKINMIEENGISYIQAHPTFFYESFLNILLFIVLIIIIKKYYKFKGQILATYLIGYGVIRFFVESLRTDSLMLGIFRVSQLVAVACVVLGGIIYVYNIKGGHSLHSSTIQESDEKGDE
ncbi:MAG: prolipoprotein diacylglyceryl transferase [Lachnospiraceae bacterium]|nr:prolipoprotein diacylglyceryl transferase [Lachnospiraceae bacterium]